MTDSGSVRDIDALEVRLATVMTGGVSLAVWMGGVTAELYRAQAGTGVYGELAEALDLRVHIDVISGTSAGGLNGVLLAAALARRLPAEEMASVARVWLEDGDLARLLRSPFEADPPSLMRGDEHFLPVIREVLTRWESTPVPVTRSPFEPEVQLLVTATTLTGEPELFEDDFGSRLDQTTHTGLFRFRHADLVADGASARLALAARTSASFPGGFEASFCPVGSTGPRGQADMDGVASFRSSRWAVDGGVLRNLPIGPAIDAIFEQPASAAVRRVLVYVNPDPGEVRDPGPDDPAATPTLVDVIASSTTSLPRHEAVGDHLAQIQAHNEQVRRQRFARRNVLEICEPADAAPLLFEQFRTLRVEHSVRSTSARLRDRASRLRLRPAGATTWQALEAALEVAATTDWLPDAFPASADLGPDGPPWQWGISPIDYGISAIAELIGNTLAAIPITDDTAAARATLIEGKRLLSMIIGTLASVRELDDAYWEVVVRLAAQRPVAEPTAWAAACYQRWPLVPEGDLDEVHGGDRADELAARRYARALAVVAAAGLCEPSTCDQGTVRRLLGGAAQSLTLAAVWIAPTVAAHQRGDVIARHLLSGGPPGDDAGLAEWTRRWLSLYVIQIAVGGVEQPREQEVRLLQVSANRAHSLDPRRRADAAVKLNGVEASHFGAFLKRSWRANDWMWGRLDGSSRLILALLDPARVAQKCPTPVAAANLVARLATGSDDGLPAPTRAAVEAELAYVGDAKQARPLSLPVSARLLADRIGTDLLREELPNVALAVVATEQDGGGMNGAAASFVTAVDRAVADAGGAAHLPVATVADLLGTCMVGEESVADELGSDAGTRLATTALAVGAGALRGQQSGLGALRNPFRVVRTAMVAVAVVARAATQTGAIGSLLIGAGLAGAGLCIGADLGGADVPGALTAASVALAVVWAVVTIAAAGTWAVVFPLIVVLGVALSLTADDLGRGLDSAPSGWRATVIESPEAATRVMAGIALVGALLVGLSLGRTVAARGWLRPSHPGRIAVIVALVATAVWLRRQGASTICATLSDGSTCPDATVPARKEDLLDGLARLRDLLPVTLAVALPAGLLGLDLLRRGSRRARLAWWEVRTATLSRPHSRATWRPIVLGVGVVVLVHNGLVALRLPDEVVGMLHLVPLAAFVLTRRAELRDSWFGSREAVTEATKLGAQAATLLLLPVAVLWAAGWIPSDDRYRALDGWHLALHCLTIVVFVAVVEEVLFRGVILGLGAPQGRAFRGVVVSSIAFGLWHFAAEVSRTDAGSSTSLGRWAGVAAGLLVTTASGFLFAWLRLRGRHVLAPTIAHAAFNIGVFLAAATVS